MIYLCCCVMRLFHFEIFTLEAILCSGEAAGPTSAAVGGTLASLQLGGGRGRVFQLEIGSDCVNQSHLLGSYVLFTFYSLQR